MPRLARIVLPGVPHHVTQRGNNKQDVFFVDDDRRVYLDLLHEQSDRFGLKIAGYCLMANHVHLVATPSGEVSLAKVIGRTDFLYTQYVNRLHRRSGHLWQNRFYSCALDEVHLWRALCYIERNPVRAGLVRRAWDYPWSSAGAHTGGADVSGPLDLAEWARLWTPDKWRAELRSPEDAQGVSRIRLSTHRGRPLGSDSFLSKLEHRLGCRLRPLPVGRPKRRTKKRRIQRRAARNG
jgi:putative transposase